MRPRFNPTDLDLLSEGIEGMRRHRQFLAAERVRLLALADQIDARLAAWEQVELIHAADLR